MTECGMADKATNPLAIRIFGNKRGGTDSTGVAQQEDLFFISYGWNLVNKNAGNTAGIFMHEMGHTLGLTTSRTGCNGIDNPKTDPNGGNYNSELYKNYKSCMNYHYTFDQKGQVLDYSDGSHGNDKYGNPDHDDWGNLDLPIDGVW